MHLSFFFRPLGSPPPYEPMMVEDDGLRAVCLRMPPLFVYLLSPTMFAKTRPEVVLTFYIEFEMHETLHRP